MSSHPSNPPGDAPAPNPPEATNRALSRRKLFGAAGVGAAVVGAASAGALAGRASASNPATGEVQTEVPFRGERQAGIVTASQDRMHFCAFDVTTDDRSEVVAMLQQWTAMAERMTRAEEAVEHGAVGLNPYAPRRYR
ncbi:hypothetical protein MMAD_43600 [Mycolicibacterium madagascariense]|uniref:Dyp-type peroxidase N-terminal domain-containing protein n=1 Tax=Mycolicibacterium madagascariense TaxID=212765 RepID=A0A7I7XLL8_9MYCO|nr:hypothetical protein MMAD_43600 [Mycolicibacterium madagascariense]